MTTWAEARAKVRGDLWRNGSQGIPDDVCDRALHASLLAIEGERDWLWLENIQTSAELLEPSDNVVAPADIGSVNTIACTTSGYEILTVKPVAFVRQAAKDSSGGTPAYYAFHNGALYFDLVAPIGSTFEIIYTARTPELVEAAVAAPSNVTLNKHVHAVIKGACVDVCFGFLRNEDEGRRQQVAYDRVLQRMMDAEDQQRDDLHGGLARPDTAYSQAAGL